MSLNKFIHLASLKLCLFPSILIEIKHIDLKLPANLTHVDDDITCGSYP